LGHTITPQEKKIPQILWPVNSGSVKIKTEIKTGTIPGIPALLSYSKTSPLRQKLTQPFKKILPIAIIPKDLSEFNAPDENIMNNSRSVQAS